MEFSRQEYWSGLPCPPPEDLLDPGIKPASPASCALQADSLPAETSGKPLQCPILGQILPRPFSSCICSVSCPEEGLILGEEAWGWPWRIQQLARVCSPHLEQLAAGPFLKAIQVAHFHFHHRPQSWQPCLLTTLRSAIHHKEQQLVESSGKGQIRCQPTFSILQAAELRPRERSWLSSVLTAWTQDQPWPSAPRPMLAQEKRLLHAQRAMVGKPLPVQGRATLPSLSADLLGVLRTHMPKHWVRWAWDLESRQNSFSQRVRPGEHLEIALSDSQNCSLPLIFILGLSQLWRGHSGIFHNCSQWIRHWHSHQPTLAAVEETSPGNSLWDPP